MEEEGAMCGRMTACTECGAQGSGSDGLGRGRLEEKD